MKVLKLQKLHAELKPPQLLLRYKMFTSQKNSDSQVEGLVLRLVLGQIRAVRLVHVLVAALWFKIQ